MVLKTVLGSVVLWRTHKPTYFQGSFPTVPLYCFLLNFSNIVLPVVGKSPNGREFWEHLGFCAVWCNTLSFVSFFCQDGDLRQKNLKIRSQTHVNTFYWRSILILYSNLCLSSHCSLSIRFSCWNHVFTSPFSHTYHMPRLSYPSWYNRPNNVWGEVRLKADSHIACRSHAAPMPFPCHAVPLRV